VLKNTLIPLSLLLFLFTQTATAENPNFTTSHFSGSGNCTQCHDNLTDTSGENVSIVRDWGTSMMANAAKDPFWKAKVATELERNAHLSSVIGDKCTKCHAPAANYEITKVQGGEVEILGPNGILNASHAMNDAALNGVTCTVCHQITDDPSLGTLEGFSGHYNINDTKTLYGQYADIFGQPMVNQTGYTPAYSAHTSTSEMCATCHELSTPYVDAQGNVLTTTPETEFPEQTPYTEWENSIFADTGSNPQSCQDCHMPQTTSKVSNRPNWLGTKDGFAKHHLVGANTTMLTLMRDNAAELGVTSNNMDLSIDRARAMLQDSVDMQIASASVSNGVLEAKVQLTNNSGHKTPTSYPSRRMWLNFRVTDSNNNVVFESGSINADGSITGADNDADQSLVEPHYDVITSADQVQIYETIMGNSDGGTTYTLLRAAQYLKDNRLTPQGFNKMSVPAKVAVYSTEAMNDANFDNGSDEVTYRIPVAASGELTIDVALNYQTIMHGFVQDLYQDNHLPEVQAFQAMYAAQSLKHEQITSAQTTVTSDGGGTPPPPVPTASISASPATIDEGQSSTISWSSTDASSCTASGAWTGNKASSGSEPVSPTTTSTYTITCDGDGGSVTQSTTVTVNAAATPAPVTSISATATTIDQGQSTTLNWSASDANSCNASGGWSGTKSVSGSELVTPAATTTYTLACDGDGGSDASSITITVNQPPATAEPTVALYASPTSVRSGSTITLSWSSTDATSCSASGNWSGNKSISGSQSLTINGNSTYMLTCTGDGGTASSSVSYSSRGRWLRLQ